MDFSTEFVAFRDRLQEGQDEAFVSRRNVEVAGRTAALLSSFQRQQRAQDPRHYADRQHHPCA